MRRGILIAGIVVLVIGILLLVLSFAVQASPQSTSMPVYPNYLSLTPTTIGSASVTVSWSAASAGTTVYLTFGTPTCANPSSVVGQCRGASGSFSASLSPGNTYALYACSDAAGGSLSTTTSGFSILGIIGIVVAVVGAIVAVVGVRARPKVATSTSAAPEENAAPEASPYFVPRPMTAQEAGSASTGTTPIGMQEGAQEPARFMPAYDPGSPKPPSTAPAPGEARPSRTCVFCGAVNESWITNCRKCKRPLSSTGDS
ncbi:MAG: hypothetical protein ACYDFT_00930 [Thermoplasmata archaeon]